MAWTNSSLIVKDVLDMALCGALGTIFRDVRGCAMRVSGIHFSNCRTTSTRPPTRVRRIRVPQCLAPLFCDARQIPSWERLPGWLHSSVSRTLLSKAESRVAGYRWSWHRCVGFRPNLERVTGTNGLGLFLAQWRLYLIGWACWGLREADYVAYLKKVTSNSLPFSGAAYFDTGQGTHQLTAMAIYSCAYIPTPYFEDRCVGADLS
jgi:hypothetical protein